VRVHGLSVMFASLKGWVVMKRFFFVTIAAFALLVPALTFAQGVETVYIPGAHPRVVVVQPAPESATVKIEKAPLTPVQVLKRHEPMAVALRSNLRVNYPAVAHCDRLIAEARRQLRANF